MMFWRAGGKGWMSDSVNYEAVCRTAPATPGLLIIYFDWQHFRNLLSNSFEGFRNYWRYVRNDSYLEEFSVEVIFQEQIEKRFLCQRKLEKRLFVGAGGQYCLLKYFLFIFVLTLKKYFLDNRIKIFTFLKKKKKYKTINLVLVQTDIKGVKAMKKLFSFKTTC